MITDEIAGYEYNGDKYCVHCMHSIAYGMLRDMGYTPYGMHAWSTEGLLNALAALENVDHEDFPVPFSRSQAESDVARSVQDDDLPVLCAGRSCGNDFTGEF